MVQGGIRNGSSDIDICRHGLFLKVVFAVWRYTESQYHMIGVRQTVLDSLFLRMSEKYKDRYPHKKSVVFQIVVYRRKRPHFLYR